MNMALFATVVASVVLSALSQILLKGGMISAAVVAAIEARDLRAILLAVATSPGILLGFVSFGLSLLLWLMVLARVPLSTAYPFVALGITVTVAAGALLFGEAISFQKLAGVGLILLGIVTLASA
jgi:multidrug transporter EmrE-like cation transporter